VADRRLADRQQLLSKLAMAALAQQERELAVQFAEALLSSSPTATEEARQLLAEVRQRLERQPVRKNLFGLTPTSELDFAEVVSEGL